MVSTANGTNEAPDASAKKWQRPKWKRGHQRWAREGRERRRDDTSEAAGWYETRRSLSRGALGAGGPRVAAWQAAGSGFGGVGRGGGVEFAAVGSGRGWPSRHVTASVRQPSSYHTSVDRELTLDERE